jgi:hypothetical protein
MIEFSDPEERKVQLAKMIGVEKAVWVQVADFARVTPIANEDLERETEDKTSSVHFLRFELTAPMVAALKAGAALNMGIDHPAYQATVTPSAAARQSLIADLK